MNQASVQKGHPKGLYILFATEMWERFNYYGMRAILILFMTKALLFDTVFASNLYGSYISLIYLSGLVGGYVADRYWGCQRSIIAGGIVMAISEFILFFCGSLYQTAPDVSALLFYTGLGLMITGNGFFKPNISSMVGHLYPAHDNRKDAAYTIFYMGINTGGALGPLVCGLVGDTGNPADFKWAFLAAGIGMIISVIVQVVFHKKYVVNPENKVLGMIPDNSPKQALSPAVTIGGLLALSVVTIGLFYIDAKVFSYLFYLLLACFVIIPAIIYTDKSLTGPEKSKVAVIIIVCFFVIFFWSAFEQTGASLTLFADKQTDRKLDLKVPVWLITALSAALVYYTITLYKKTAKGLASAYHNQLRGTVYFLLFLLAASLAGANIYLYATGKSQVLLYEVPTSWFQSLNSTFIILFAPFFAWFWLQLKKHEPSSPTKMAIGLLVVGLGYLWIAWGVSSGSSGGKASMMWLVILYALHTCGELCLSPIGLSLVNKLSPIKFASLLMAVWFTANAFGNKVAGSLSALYPDGRTTNFLGYQMANLYDFFMLFVFMCGIAALILFLLTKKLQRMMV
ncbi:peptide MFS transporter [Foetidibacter luteolus]|uniref:peptide MFS transporter n=1 Tax=Foetidibacter luteolus TaxID=2608880 RepID=UPI00129A3405|nr:peptide MFS transporter [Foetidibacter luteolus]